MDDIIDSKDPEGLRLAFEAVRPELDTVAEIRVANTDMRKAIIFAASVGRMVTLPERLTAFASLPATFFNMVHVARLEQVADATFYAWLQTADARALHTGSRMPLPNLVEMTALRTVMIKVLEYNVGDNEAVSKKLASIRPGHGHADTGSDLWRLGVLYEEHAAALAADTRLYKPEDAVKAKRYAQAINHVLGDGTESDALFWGDYLGRAWTLLVNTYDEVAAAGRWMFRHENGEAMFPSLYAVGRQPRRSRRSDEELPDSGELDPEQPVD